MRWNGKALGSEELLLKDDALSDVLLTMNALLQLGRDVWYDPPDQRHEQCNGILGTNFVFHLILSIDTLARKKEEVNTPEHTAYNCFL